MKSHFESVSKRENNFCLFQRHFLRSEVEKTRLVFHEDINIWYFWSCSQCHIWHLYMGHLICPCHFSMNYVLFYCFSERQTIKKWTDWVSLRYPKRKKNLLRHCNRGRVWTQNQGESPQGLPLDQWRGWPQENCQGICCMWNWTTDWEIHWTSHPIARIVWCTNCGWKQENIPHPILK